MDTNKLTAAQQYANVCADCGHETDAPNGPCVKCRGYRIVAQSFVAEVFGADWRDAFKEPVGD